MVFVADPRAYSGWQAWLTNLYHENLLYYTVLTVLVVPSLALVLGTLTSAIMSRIGIDLESGRPEER